LTGSPIFTTSNPPLNPVNTDFSPTLNWFAPASEVKTPPSTANVIAFIIVILRDAFPALQVGILLIQVTYAIIKV
jgi:hypothetical protein